VRVRDDVPRPRLYLDALSVWLSSAAAAESPATRTPSPQLADKVWRVTAPGNRAPGTVYVFLSDGTLMMTSGVETYRLAVWRADSATRLTIVEDAVVSYGADVLEMTDRLLRLRLALKSENVELTLEPAQTPAACPDLRR
jgi:hypothetical protein